MNTLPQGETTCSQASGGSQSGNCGGTTCIRWGDYSAMTVDPDGCTFWYTTEYYAATGLNWQTRIGSFTFPNCTLADANRRLRPRRARPPTRVSPSRSRCTGRTWRPAT